MARTRLILAGALLLVGALATLALAASAKAQDTANQAPRANFKVVPNSPSVGQRTRFNGSASKDTDGSIVSYAWDYGDGTTKTETDPTSFHTYDQPGTYTATLRVTDNQGCTAGDPYNICRNSDRALETKTVTVVDRGVLGPKVTAQGRQPQRGRRVRVAVEAGAREQVRAVATGFIRIEGRNKRIALGRVETTVLAKERNALVLAARGRPANRRVFKALAGGRVVRATVAVKLVDSTSNEVTQFRSVRLL